MTQILTVKYTKEEETVVLLSNVLGISVGIPLGLLLGYLMGLFTDMMSAAFSSIGWAIFTLKIGLATVPLSWAATIAICFFFWKKKNWIQSKQETRRMIPGTLVFPLTLVFGFVVMAFIIFPLCFLVLDYTNRPLTGFVVGSLALLPFMIIIIAILLPDTPAGKALRRFTHRLKRKHENDRKY
jgi:MFS family permease